MQKELHLKGIKLGLLGEEIIKHAYEQAGWYVKYGMAYMWIS
jgi:hypothetical protein